MKYLITGATGFVGRSLVEKLDRPIVTSRNAEKARRVFGDSVSDVIQWNPTQEKIPLDDAHGIDAVINLMGHSIATRWTKKVRKKIVDSRIIGTRNLVQGMMKLTQKPKALIAASAVGFYGTRGDQVIDENDLPGGQQEGSSECEKFLADLCQQWEDEASAAAVAGVRVVLARIGIVLGTEGGALDKMVPIFKWGLGARMGSGKQYMPWIHIEDLVNIIEFASRADVTGPMNSTAPNPVTNKEFTQALAKKLRRPGFAIAPKFAVRLLTGQFGESLFFSQRVIPRVATEHGFEFKFPDLQSALDDLLG